MKRLFSIVLSLSLIGALAACGGGQQAAPAPAPAEQPAAEQPTAGGTVDATAAEAKYNQACAACHGNDLSGGMGPGLQKVGSKLSQDEILAVITKGKGSMPPKLLQGADAELVAAWLADHK